MQTYIHAYIHKYSDFLVVLISAGLAQARPNYHSKMSLITATCIILLNYHRRVDKSIMILTLVSSMCTLIPGFI